ncbi:hypothetical protein K501DRAFT_273073 [Backusella circina FSU 941]|nr:hypothetical protein K501DRAFT_273073 [Backusella circina FSU 941]
MPNYLVFKELFILISTKTIEYQEHINIMDPAFNWIYVTGTQWDVLPLQSQLQLERLWSLGISGTINIPTFPGPVYVDEFCTSITYVDLSGNHTTCPIARVNRNARLA